MTPIHHNTTTSGADAQRRGRAIDYFVRYRFLLYLLLGAAAASGVALNWNWLAAAGLLPILAFLPCMLMMFMCMKHGTRGPARNEEMTAPDKTVSFRLPRSDDPQH